MPMLERRFHVPYPGYVDIFLHGMQFRFSKEALEIAILHTKAIREKFDNEKTYQETLGIYEQALRLLKEEQK